MEAKVRSSHEASATTLFHGLRLHAPLELGDKKCASSKRSPNDRSAVIPPHKHHTTNGLEYNPLNLCIENSISHICRYSTVLPQNSVSKHFNPLRTQNSKEVAIHLLINATPIP
ncbi:hypothetical protein M758_12G032100 [Ceratodon purpureus]|nr:hypothetical protein M758_12G032100 [Ceratodon purpureus]